MGYNPCKIKAKWVPMVSFNNGQSTAQSLMYPGPLEIASLMIRAYEHHWFPLIRKAIKPLFLRGVFPLLVDFQGPPPTLPSV